MSAILTFTKLLDLVAYIEYNISSYKGGANKLMKNKNNSKKTTLYLDLETKEYLKSYSLEVLKSGSISEAVRTIAKEHNDNTKKETK